MYDLDPFALKDLWIAVLLKKRRFKGTTPKVFSSILAKTFNTGRKVAENFKENMRIQFDDYLPHGSMELCNCPSKNLRFGSYKTLTLYHKYKNYSPPKNYGIE